MSLNLPLLPTTLVGSWSQPGWLIDRARLDGHVPVRVTDHSLWRVDDAWLAEAQDDATIVAVAEQDRLGLDIVTDGEARRESYSNRFANALEGIDHDHPGEMLDRTGTRVPAPRVAGPIERARPVERDVVALMKRFTDKPVKITLPGPFTMTQQAQNDYYASDVELAATSGCSGCDGGDAGHARLCPADPHRRPLDVADDPGRRPHPDDPARRHAGSRRRHRGALPEGPGQALRHAHRRNARRAPVDRRRHRP